MKWFRFLVFLPPGASTFADGIDALHLFVISVTMLLALGVAAVVLFYIVRYRRRSRGQITERNDQSVLGETVIVASTMAMFVVFWVIGFIEYVRLETPPADAMRIQVTAQQWMWKFSYPDGRRAINVLTVPVGRPVRLVMTARDVIHSLYIPAFRIKQDVIPGRYVSAWFEATAVGSYDLYCAEFCGVSHSNMLATVHVLSLPDYESWLAQGDGTGALADDSFATAGGVGTQNHSDFTQIGRAIAVRRQCVACHTIDGQRHIGPSWRGVFGSTIQLADGRSVVADEAYLTRSMMDPLADVRAGFNAVMPTYQGLLPAPEVAALVEYIKSLRDGDVEPTVVLPTLGDADVSPGDAAAEAISPSTAPTESTQPLDGGF